MMTQAVQPAMVKHGSAHRARIESFLGASLALAVATSSSALAQSVPPAPVTVDPYHELETKYIFGFTSGSDIGAEGEKSVEFETTAAFQKRHGQYSRIEQEIEFEGVPTQNFAYELSAHGTYHGIHGVDGLANNNVSQFSGLSADLRYLLIGRGPGSPFGLTLAMSPEWSRVDGTAGTQTRDFSNTFKILADTELIANRLYAAANVSYGPEVSRAPLDLDWTKESSLGFTTALAYRIAPKVTLGAEAEYYRAYDGLTLNSLSGQAVYVGPTLHIQFTGKTMLALAYSNQVWGRATGEMNRLDLTNFEHHHFNAKLEFEF